LNPCFPSDLKYKVVAVMDVPWENLSKHFHSCSKFIKQALDSGGSVFVHCYAGVSRSATIVTAFLMKEHSMTMLNALTLVK
jgi:protein-tyrosine phosphatase